MFENSWFFHSKPVPVRIHIINVNTIFMENFKVWGFPFPFHFPFPACATILILKLG